MQSKNWVGKNLEYILVGLALSLTANLHLITAAKAIESAAYIGPPRPKQVGLYAKNYKLRESALLAKGKIKGPEDIAVDADGIIYAGSADGKIYKISTTLGAEKIQLFADLGGGQTLGLMFSKHDGRLIACNCPRGLFAVSKNGDAECLTNALGDTKITYPDDLDIAHDGKIYFSMATVERGNLNGYKNMFVDLLECQPHGQLLVFDPANGKTTSLLDGLYFANGVALSPDEDYVLVAETYRYRIKRYWLKGPKTGTSDVFADNLPGMPDGITRDPYGGYWLALVVPRTAYMDFVQARPRLKKFFAHIPIGFWGRMPHYGMVLKLDDQGSVTESLQDPSGKVTTVTNVVPWKDYLFLGSLQGRAIGRYKLNQLTGARP